MIKMFPLSLMSRPFAFPAAKIHLRYFACLCSSGVSSDHIVIHVINLGYDNELKMLSCTEPDNLTEHEAMSSLAFIHQYRHMETIAVKHYEYHGVIEVLVRMENGGCTVMCAFEHISG